MDDLNHFLFGELPMASVSYADTTPSFFSPDATTPEGMYMNNLNKLAMIVDGKVVEVDASGNLSVRDIANFTGQIRGLIGTDEFTIVG